MHFDERFLASMEPAVQRAFADMGRASNQAPSRNPDEKRMVGHYCCAPRNAPRQDGPRTDPGTTHVLAHLRMKWSFGPVSDNAAFRELSNDLFVDSASQFARFQVFS